MNVSIIIPARNEEENIEHLLKDVYSVFKTNKYSGKIIVIDDCSTDETLHICNKLKEKIPLLMTVHHKECLGKSAAIQSGVKNSNSDFIIMIDADYQYDPNDIPKIVDELKRGYKLVSGWRIKRKDPSSRLIFSYFFNLINRILFGIEIHDVNCGLKGYSSDIFNKVNLEFPKWFVDTELLAKLSALKIPIKEVKIRHYPRKHGNSKINCFETPIETLINCARLKVLLLRRRPNESVAT